MADACSCDYGDRPAMQHHKRIQARKTYGCYECGAKIRPGDRYERCASLYEGLWTVARVCPACLAARDYVAVHAPCFCWMYGSMLDDAKDTLNQYGEHSAGFFIGGMKRVLRAERQIFAEPRVFPGTGLL